MARVVAIIPARGGSKRLPRKNIYPVFGKPMLKWAIEACQRAEQVMDTFVSTEDGEIKQLALKLGVKVIDRPAELAADNVWTQDVLRHAVETLTRQGLKFDVVARIQANSPQVEARKIDEAIEKLERFKLWEVFSVDQAGLEDAAIHVLKKECVFQNALSVYKGVVTTNYVDIHTKEDIAALEKKIINKIEQDSLNFLAREERLSKRRGWRARLSWVLGEPSYQLWRWQQVVPLYTRWQAIAASSEKLRSLLFSSEGYQRAQTMSVLDLGCGFGMYWPVMHQWGFKTFVGVDLFDLRKKEAYLRTAQKYIAHFCPDCETQFIMDDARNLSNYKLLRQQFDVILAVATTCTKVGSTAIPRDVFTGIVQRYGKKDCIPVFVEHIDH